MADTPPTEAAPATMGERLRAAREEQGLELAEIAARTRIQLRHLAAIENSDFGALPSPAYAIGFSKAYARAVGIDETMVARDLRGRLSNGPMREAPARPQDLEEPSRLPGRGLTIGLVIGFLVLVIAAAAYYGGMVPMGADDRAAVAEDLGVRPAAVQPVPAATPAAQAPAGGPVVLTATGEVWVRIYDAANTTLLIRTLQQGDRFEVPANADRPMINVGRPDLLAVTVGGQAVAPLGTAERAIKDVEISAAALLARGSAAPAPAPTMPTASVARPDRGASRSTRVTPSVRPSPTPAPSAVSDAPGTTGATEGAAVSAPE
ncbi:helix-turn-helix domain-containing protein [Sphingomonas sp. CJ99]